jgi:hypothetical protein
MRFIHKDLARAILAYDQAIQSCADDPEKMASFCTAEGDRLDDLYFRMLELARFILSQPETASEGTLQAQILKWKKGEPNG